LAGGEWPKRAREAAERLTRRGRRPSDGVQLRAWFYVFETDLTGTYANKTVAPLPNVGKLKLPPKLANRG
jgi:hypothetical protein